MSEPPVVVPPSRMPAGYEFVRMLGRGGNGWVALARHQVLGRQVAVKAVFGAANDADGQRRLTREGQALARLHDPRVVQIYELVRSHEDVMLVVEFVDGMDLEAAAPSLTSAARIRILRDVAGALETTAAAGIVHRDVKPANVLVARDGSAKLTDFGIARLTLSSAAYRTASSVVSGTPRYVAPEQLTDPDHESPASDAYSFAVMAYELLVGRPPFRAETREAMVYAHLAVAPLPALTLNPALPAELAQTLMAGLSKNPADRPMPMEIMASVGSDIAALTTVATSLPIELTPGWAASSAPWADPAVFVPRRPSLARRVPPFAVGAVFALVVLALIVALH